MKKALMALTCALALGAAAPASAQQAYPSKPIQIVVPFLPGGSPDMVARQVGQQLSEALGQQVVIDNRPGANGIIGAQTVAKAAPDGYTLLLADTGQLSINPSLYAKLPYDPLKHFTPISYLMATPLYIAVNAALPVKNLQELVALSKSGKPLQYGSSGNGSALHLGMELFKSVSGANLEHIPYKGVAQTTPALVSGEVSVMLAGWAALGPHVKSGKIRVLAVGGATRSPAHPDIPTVAESGYPGFDIDSRNGLLAPAGTPMEIVLRLNREIARILDGAQMRERLGSTGIDVLHSTPEAYTEAIRRDTAKYAKIVKEVGVKLD